MSDWKLAESIAARGTNLVCLAPPSPSAARRVLAGVLQREALAGAGLSLALAPGEAVAEWARVAAQLATQATQRIAAGHTPDRVSRLLSIPGHRLILTTPETAYELVRHAALRLGELSALLLLSPETWGEEGRITDLLPELGKDAQRIIFTADPEATASLREGYCWRAPVIDLLGPQPADRPPPVQSMPVAWNGRTGALLDLIELVNPGSLGVWIVDSADRELVELALEPSGTSFAVSATPPSGADLIAAYDLPSPSQLRALATTGDLVLLVPPGTEAYVARLAPDRRPLHGGRALEGARRELARIRRRIAQVVERGPSASTYHTLAPLLERYEAPALAAALHELWQEAQETRVTPTGSEELRGASVRLWVGIGKQDGVTPHDLVAVLVNQGVGREAIGRIDIRERFSLIELGAAADGEQVAERLAGKTIRKRRLVARVDRGRPARRDR